MLVSTRWKGEVPVPPDACMDLRRMSGSELPSITNCAVSKNLYMTRRRDQWRTYRILSSQCPTQRRTVHQWVRIPEIPEVPCMFLLPHLNTSRRTDLPPHNAPPSLHHNVTSPSLLRQLTAKDTIPKKEVKSAAGIGN